MNPTFRLFLFSTFIVLASCGRQKEIQTVVDQGTVQSISKSGVGLKVSEDTSHCANGGIVVQTYNDKNSNNLLDESEEILSENIVCSGVNGLSGTNGADGKDGINGTNGADGKDGINGTNGADGKDGINGTNGADGTNGVNGQDGVSAGLQVLAATTSQCAHGGLVAKVFIDTDRDGALDSGEQVISTTVSCIPDAVATSVPSTGTTVITGLPTMERTFDLTDNDDIIYVNESYNTLVNGNGGVNTAVFPDYARYFTYVISGSTVYLKFNGYKTYVLNNFSFIQFGDVGYQLVNGDLVRVTSTPATKKLQ